MDERTDCVNKRWLWRQVWRDVLFLHWRMEANDLRPHLPAALAIDTHEGDAWVSLVLFRLEVSPIGWPRVPGFSSLVEANLRTYVMLDEQPGIYFFSIHADNLAALTLARLLTPLPYLWAEIDYQTTPAASQCRLRRSAAPVSELSLAAEIDSGAAPGLSGPQTDWLLERYRAFASVPRATSLQTATVAHKPWQTQPARVTVASNTLGGPFGLNLDRPPDAAHSCRQMPARFSRFAACTAGCADQVGAEVGHGLHTACRHWRAVDG